MGVMTPGGFNVLDVTGQALACLYARESEADAGTANVLSLERRNLDNATLDVAPSGGACRRQDFPERTQD